MAEKAAQRGSTTAKQRLDTMVGTSMSVCYSVLYYGVLWCTAACRWRLMELERFYVRPCKLRTLL